MLKCSTVRCCHDSELRNSGIRLNPYADFSFFPPRPISRENKFVGNHLDYKTFVGVVQLFRWGRDAGFDWRSLAGRRRWPIFLKCSALSGNRKDGNRNKKNSGNRIQHFCDYTPNLSPAVVASRAKQKIGTESLYSSSFRSRRRLHRAAPNMTRSDSIRCTP